MVAGLLELGPSALELEVRCLGPEGGGTIGLMVQFLHMVKAALANFEAVQSYLGLFLRVHGETVAGEEELVQVLEQVQQVQVKLRLLPAGSVWCLAAYAYVN
jgi:U3 small nucleolar RNA-associated protein 21